MGGFFEKMWTEAIYFGAGGAGTMVIIWFLKKIINHYFEGKVKNHFTEMQKKLDFEYQRLIADFGMYSKKRHQIYPKLYKLGLEVENRISTVDSIAGNPDFTDFSREDIVRYLNFLKVTEQIKTEVLAFWDANDKDSAIAVIRNYEYLRNLVNANHTLIKLKRHFGESRLYLSDDVELLLESLCVHLEEFIERSDKDPAMKQFQNLKRTIRGAAYFDNEALEGLIQKNIEDLKTIMKEELSKGYY